MSAPRARATLAGIAVALAAAAAAAQSSDVEKHYPVAEHVVRWYTVKDARTGRTVDYTSFALVARQRGDDGRLVYVVENRHAGGVGLDYEEVGPAQLQLDRLLAGRPDGTVADAVFSPPLPRLRAPLEPGRSWTETPRGDKPYVYTVESRFALSVRGKVVQDCVRVVRTRDGAADLKTDYCPGIGMAGFDTLRGSRWLRADLLDLAGEMDLIGVRASSRGCEYVFEPLAFPDEEELSVSVRGPGLPAETLKHPSQQNLHVGLAPDARHGRWLVRVEGKQRTARHVIYWNGECRGAFLVPPPARGPSLTLVAQDATPGSAKFTLVGTGWKPGEPLLLTTAGAGWETQTSPLGKADVLGRSNPAVVPIADTAARGEYIFTLRGAAQSATLALVCRAEGFCAVKSRRVP